MIHLQVLLSSRLVLGRYITLIRLKGHGERRERWTKILGPTCIIQIRSISPAVTSQLLSAQEHHNPPVYSLVLTVICASCILWSLQQPSQKMCEDWAEVVLVCATFTPHISLNAAERSSHYTPIHTALMCREAHQTCSACTVPNLLTVFPCSCRKPDRKLIWGFASEGPKSAVCLLSIRSVLNTCGIVLRGCLWDRLPSRVRSWRPVWPCWAWPRL